MKRVPTTEHVIDLIRQASLPPAVRRVLANGFAWLRTVVTIFDLAYRSRRKGEAIEVWVGDSHAMWCNATATMARVSRAPTGAYVWHLGPRLMWSIARDGFPREVATFFRVLGVWMRGEVIPVFVLGEIDVRCHLAGRDADMSFVAAYAERVEALVGHLHRPFAILAVPPPPSAGAPLSDLPVRGDFRERVAAFQSLRAGLRRASSEPGGPLTVLDVTEDLLGESGLRAEYTDDGIHTNRRGVVVFRAELATVLGR